MRSSAHYSSIELELPHVILMTVVTALVLLSPLVFCTWMLEGFETPKRAVLIAGSLILMGLGLTHVARAQLSQVQVSLRILFAGPVEIGFTLLALSAILSIWFSMNPRVSLMGAHPSYQGVFTLLGYVVLFFAVRIVAARPRSVETLFWAITATGGLIAAYGTAQAFGFDFLNWGRSMLTYGEYSRPFSTLGHPNHMAAYLITAFPVVGWCMLEAVKTRRWPLMGCCALVSILLLLAVVASISRGAWLALGCSLPVFLIGVVLAKTETGRTRALIIVGAATLALIVTSTVAWFFVPALRDVIGERVANLFNSSSRLQIWAVALQMFLENPVFGTGLDTFDLAFSPQRTTQFWITEWNALPARAHNEFLNILATQGLIGGLAVVLIFIGLGRAAARSWHQQRSDRLAIDAIVAALVGFCIQNLFNFTTIGCGVLFAVLAGLLAAPSRSPYGFGENSGTGIKNKKKAQPGLNSGFVSYGMVAVIWAAVAGVGHRLVVQPLQASIECRNSVWAASSDPKSSLESARRATVLEPWNDLYWAKRGEAAQRAAGCVADPAQQVGFLQEARQGYERAARMVPQDGSHHANLGRILAGLFQQRMSTGAAVFQAFEDALRCDPHNPYYFIDAGNAALLVGSFDRVEYYASRCHELFPYLAHPYVQLGHVALKEQDHQKAKRLFSQATRASWYEGHERESVIVVLSALAYGLEITGQPEQAIGLYHRVLKHDPHHRPSRDGLMRLNSRANNPLASAPN